MNEKYFAVIDGVCVQYIGEFDSIGQAFENEPANTTWIHNERTLRTLIQQAQSALENK